MKHKFFRGLGAILFKEFIIVWRDPMTLFFMFFPPLIEMVAFGYALDNDVKHMAMLILNEDRTVESRLLIDRFVNTGLDKPVMLELLGEIPLDPTVRESVLKRELLLLSAPGSPAGLAITAAASKHLAG